MDPFPSEVKRKLLITAFYGLGMKLKLRSSFSQAEHDQSHSSKTSSRAGPSIALQIDSTGRG